MMNIEIADLLKIYLVLINIFSFAVYGIDKAKAKKEKWRIPESTLLILSAAGGSLGAWIAMYLFRHKTKKRKFVFGIPLMILIQGAILLCVEYNNILW